MINLDENKFRYNAYYYDEYYDGTESLQGEFLHSELYDLSLIHI